MSYLSYFKICQALFPPGAMNGYHPSIENLVDAEDRIIAKLEVKGLLPLEYFYELVEAQSSAVDTAATSDATPAPRVIMTRSQIAQAAMSASPTLNISESSDEQSAPMDHTASDDNSAAHAPPPSTPLPQQAPPQSASLPEPMAVTSGSQPQPAAATAHAAAGAVAAASQAGQVPITPTGPTTAAKPHAPLSAKRQERKDLHEVRRRRAAPPPGYRVVGCAVPMKALLQFAADDRLIPESVVKMAGTDFFDVRLSMDGRGFADQFNTIGAFMRP